MSVVAPVAPERIALSLSSHPYFTRSAALGTSTAQLHSPMVRVSTFRGAIPMATLSQAFLPSGVSDTPFFLMSVLPSSWRIDRMVLVLPSPIARSDASFLRPIGDSLLRKYRAFQM